MIYARRADEVFQTMDALLDDLGAEAAYRSLFDRALEEVRRCADAGATFLAIDVPLAVSEALERPPLEQRVAAAACTLLWSGADLMDDAADGELPQVWREVPPSQLALVSANLLSTLPHLVTSALAGHAPGEAALARFSQRVSWTLWEMSRGQFLDLDSARRVQSIDAYSDLIGLKTGAEVAFFASAPALLAGLPDEQVEGWSAFGAAYGRMAQVFSDVASCFKEPPANDLMAGKRTLPVLHTLDVLDGAARRDFEADLEGAAAGNVDAARRAIRCMTQRGAARFGLTRVELMRHRAVQSLPLELVELAIDHPMRTVLRQFQML
jgi:geranylgeranyl pyrophosphate synthase